MYFDCKVAHYTRDSTFFMSLRHNMAFTGRYFVKLSDWLYIIKAQWSKALVLWTTDPEFKSAGDFCLKLLN